MTEQETSLNIDLPQLLPWQEEVFKNQSQFRVVCVGRRAGKTQLGTVEALTCALNGGLVFWVAPVLSQTNPAWKEMKNYVWNLNKLAPGSAVVRESPERIIEFSKNYNGGIIYFKSADDPNSLRGYGLDLCIIDEAAFCKVEAWTDAIRPSLSDRRGRVLFISTPRGKNWFFHLWQRGNQVEYPDWASWQLPTTVNPLIPVEDIEEAKASLPELKYKAEYMALFTEGGHSVFRNIEHCINTTRQDKAEEGHEYVFGVDWGRYNDYTVITTIDVTTKEVVNIERFSNTEYDTQKHILKQAYSKFKPSRIIAEKNNMGDVLTEQLKKEGLPIEQFWTSNRSKNEIIEALAFAFEKKEISIYRHTELINELSTFESYITKSGLAGYGAASSFHDDCVMSLAIGWSCFLKPKPQLVYFPRNLIGI